MLVRELIEKLKEMDQEKEVWICGKDEEDIKAVQIHDDDTKIIIR